MKTVVVCAKRLREAKMWLLAAGLAAVAGIPQVQGAVRGLYVGNDFYPPINNVAAAKASGFNTLFLFALHVYAFSDNTTGASVSGTLSGAAISQITFLRANGNSATINNGNDFNFNGLAIYVPTDQPVALKPNNPGWKLSFTATPCLNYRVQRAASVAGPWTNLGSVFGWFNSCEFTDSNSPASRTY